MATEKAPAYQWYPKDAETDEAYRLMTCEELGVYERLRDHQWLEGSLPSLIESLALVVGHGMTKHRLERIWPKIAPCFPDDGHGRLVNPRLERQRQELSTFLGGQKRRGRAGGLAKAEKRKAESASHIVAPLQISTPVATAQPLANPSSASASASASTHKERAYSAHTGSGVLAGQLPRDHLRHAVCGRVCLPESQFVKFARKLGGEEEAARSQIRLWARSVLEEWNAGVKGTTPIQGNDFQWWDARWEEWQGRPVAAKRLTEDPDAMNAGVLELLRKDGTLS